ncbi:unnamed protein product [Cuscuta epithymum]|uniref:Secreted protein n=1 Tax=Cuscuta epithymum TaxID=186058 RepID=A0AAV0CPR1_9ASTE|nr:unnamed protein product [Cuscuta epithymum]
MWLIHVPDFSILLRVVHFFIFFFLSTFSFVGSGCTSSSAKAPSLQHLFFFFNPPYPIKRCLSFLILGISVGTEEDIGQGLLQCRRETGVWVLRNHRKSWAFCHRRYVVEVLQRTCKFTAEFVLVIIRRHPPTVRRPQRKAMVGVVSCVLGGFAEEMRERGVMCPVGFLAEEERWR